MKNTNNNLTQLFLLIATLNFIACFDITGSSENEVLQAITSPSKQKKAILFAKYAGTTVENSLQVSLTENGYELSSSDTGNIFIATSEQDKAQPDSLTIQLTWKSEDTLLIRYNKHLRIFKNEKLNDKTVIKYEPFEPI